MKASRCLKTGLLGSAVGLGLTTAAFAERFNIAPGDLNAALSAYAIATGTQLVVSADAVRGVRTQGVSGDYSVDEALSRILTGTGFTARHKPGTSIIVRDNRSSLNEGIQDIQIAQAVSQPHASVETVTVTSSKLGGADVQSVPIAITALSQEQLTSTQTAGGPDLVKQVPNLTFSKTNFTGYNIQIRGIGTQAISVTTDPAVAVAFNDTPFIRNHFFEQEFYDVGQLEVLRGPQGTLYGRNATAGVVNMVSARPTDQFEAMISGDVGNYKSRRLEGMVNIPIVDDRLDLRVAGEWTKREGYTLNETSGEQVDGRNLWSGRVTLGMKPSEHFQAYLIWEHFAEDDDRERSTKQLCAVDPGPTQVGPFNQSFTALGGRIGWPSDITVHINQGDMLDISASRSARGALSQGCLPASLYSPESYQTPNGSALPIVYAAQIISNAANNPLMLGVDPYASETQSRNLRVIQSALKPLYKAKNDIVEFMADYDVAPSLKLTSQTGFNQDFLASTEDFNRFNSNPGLFFSSPDQANPEGFGNGSFGAAFTPGGFMCDPQLGCSDRFVGEDLSQEHAWQLSQEIRLASDFKGPFNFSVGGNYLHYETLEDYYVFLNVLTLVSRYQDDGFGGPKNANGLCNGLPQPQVFTPIGGSRTLNNCPYTDPTPLSLGFNGQGHNYFRSTNPYILSSYAGFGEVYYQVRDDLKLTGGLRWTDDQKHFVEIPSQVLAAGWGYPISGVIDQQWKEVTGRAVINWTPKLDFTDQTLVYASFSRGYKAGGANPPVPNPLLGLFGTISTDSVTHPKTFAPEFVNAFELGTKDTLLDGALTINGDVFYYDYKGYQISQIVDRSSINLNFNARVRGAEIETTYEPLPGLRFNFAGGWEDTKLANGSQAIDLMDRTAGHTDWQVVKPSVFSTSNCILPQYVIAELAEMGLINTLGFGEFGEGGKFISSLGTGMACEVAYNLHGDPVTYAQDHQILTINPERAFPASGFDPATAPNNGEGFDKDLSGNQLPNAPPLTVSFGAQYSMPLTPDWAGTIRADYYWQDYSWARVFNDNPYDRLRGYTNVNLTFILTNQNGWQAMAYAKNLFDTTAITGAFLNSDDTALTTNVFTTDPRLIGVRVTKNW